MRLVLAGVTIACVACVELIAFSPSESSTSAVAPMLSDVPLTTMSDENTALMSPTLKTDRLPRLIDREHVSLVVDDSVSVSVELPPLTAVEFCEALTQAAEANDIPAPFFARLLWQESKFKHDARSHVGAQGVAQFMPATAADVGLDNPFDPRQALPASARFLRRLHDQFGNLGLAAAAYNAGAGRIQNWLARRGPLPDETRGYVRVITGNPAESWKQETKTVALHQELPRTAPCEGVGGLSRKKEIASVAVALTPGISDIVKKAEAETARLAAAAKEKLRLALAKNAKKKAIVVAVKDKSSAEKFRNANAEMTSKPRLHYASAVK